MCVTVPLAIHAISTLSFPWMPPDGMRLSCL